MGKKAQKCGALSTLGTSAAAALLLVVALAGQWYFISLDFQNIDYKFFLYKIDGFDGDESDLDQIKILYIVSLVFVVLALVAEIVCAAISLLSLWKWFKWVPNGFAIAGLVFVFVAALQFLRHPAATDEDWQKLLPTVSPRCLAELCDKFAGDDSARGAEWGPSYGWILCIVAIPFAIGAVVSSFLIKEDW